MDGATDEGWRLREEADRFDSRERGMALKGKLKGSATGNGRTAAGKRITMVWKLIRVKCQAIRGVDAVRDGSRSADGR